MNELQTLTSSPWTMMLSWHQRYITGFVQKSDGGFPDFSRTNLLLFPDFSRHFVHLHVNKTLQNWILNAEICYAMYSSILNIEWDSNF